MSEEFIYTTLFEVKEIQGKIKLYLANLKSKSVEELNEIFEEKPKPKESNESMAACN